MTFAEAQHEEGKSCTQDSQQTKQLPPSACRRYENNKRGAQPTVFFLGPEVRSHLMAYFYSIQGVSFRLQAADLGKSSDVVVKLSATPTHMVVNLSATPILPSLAEENIPKKWELVPSGMLSGE